MDTEQENPDENPLEENQSSEDEIEITPPAEESLPEGQEPWEERQSRASTLEGDFDVDAALASIATLGDLGMGDEDEDEFESDEDIDEDQFDDEGEADSYEPDADTRVRDSSRQRTAPKISAPPIYDFSRGQLASIVPAIVLMIYGAWLTFALSSDAAPSLAEALIFALIGIGISLLGYWFSSGRQANGAGMMALSLIAIPLTLFLLNTQESLGIEGWPLLVAAFGAALFVSSTLSRGSTAKGGFTGLLLILMGAFAYVLTTQTLDFDMDKSAEILLPVLGVVAVVLLIAPLLPRRH